MIKTIIITTDGNMTSKEVEEFKNLCCIMAYKSKPDFKLLNYTTSLIEKDFFKIDFNYDDR